MRVHVVVNPHAALFRQAPEHIAAVVDACRERARVAITDTVAALDGACIEAHEQGAELVVMCGGDGSYMAGVSSLARTYGARPLPAVCLAPGGSTSTVARNWGVLLRDPAKHVRTVLNLAANGDLTISTRPTLRVREGAGDDRVGFIFGTGLVRSFFESFYATGGGGPRQAASLVARIVVGALTGGQLARKVLAPMPCRLRVDGNVHPAHAFTLIVSSVVRDLGLHLLVTHRAAEDPLRPHLVASTLGVRECGMQYPRVLRGRPLMGPGTVDTLAGSFEVEFATAGGGYVLDGDPIRCRTVRVSAGPSLRVASLRSPSGRLQ